MKRIFAAAALTLLAACSQPNLNEQNVNFDFKQYPAIRVNAAQLRVDQHYVSPGQRPNVEQEFTPTPAQALEIWAQDRLQPVGTTGFVVVSVEDASVKQIVPPKKDGLSGVFTGPRQVSYQAVVTANVSFYDGVNTMSLAQAHVSVNRTKTLSEDATDLERKVFYAKFLKEIMTQFDTEARLQIQQYFAQYLR